MYLLWLFVFSIKSRNKNNIETCLVIYFFQKLQGHTTGAKDDKGQPHYTSEWARVFVRALKHGKTSSKRLVKDIPQAIFYTHTLTKKAETSGLGCPKRYLMWTPSSRPMARLQSQYIDLRQWPPPMANTNNGRTGLHWPLPYDQKSPLCYITNWSDFS